MMNNPFGNDPFKDMREMHQKMLGNFGINTDILNNNNNFHSGFGMGFQDPGRIQMNNFMQNNHNITAAPGAGPGYSKSYQTSTITKNGKSVTVSKNHEKFGDGREFKEVRERVRDGDRIVRDEYYVPSSDGR